MIEMKTPYRCNEPRSRYYALEERVHEYFALHEREVETVSCLRTNDLRDGEWTELCARAAIPIIQVSVIGTVRRHLTTGTSHKWIYNISFAHKRHKRAWPHHSPSADRMPEQLRGCRVVVRPILFEVRLQARALSHRVEGMIQFEHSLRSVAQLWLGGGRDAHSRRRCDDGQ
jgi:hypothetical protein